MIKIKYIVKDRNNNFVFIFIVIENERRRLLNWYLLERLFGNWNRSWGNEYIGDLFRSNWIWVS